MKRNFVYTIVYFKDSKFFMVSANCFSRKSSAERCAREFCESRKYDGCLWDFDIEKMEVRSYE